MSDFKRQYKKPPITFGNMKRIKVNLAHEQRARRRKRRTHDFEESRKDDSPCSAVSQKDELRTKLLNWKAERKRKKKAQELQKKPPFVVGIVRHHIYSPISTINASIAPTEKKKTVVEEHKNPNIKKGITKATKKRLEIKAENAKRKQEKLPNLVKNKFPTTKVSSNERVESDANRRESFAPLNHKFNPPAGLPKIYLLEASIEGDPLNKNNTFVHEKLMETAVQQDSYRCNSVEAITLKVSSDEQETSDSLRRKQTNSLAPNSWDLSDNLTIKGAIENSDVPIEKKHTIEYFERKLNEEKNRLQKLCKEWMEIQSQRDIIEDIRYQINQAVGQTTMLIKKKFKQFHGLILACARNDGDMLVTCMDLHGFWDMMYIEVKDCDLRFAKLEKLRARCWREDHSPFAISTKPKEKMVTKKKVVPARKSSQRALILSDKKNKTAEIQDNEKKQIINVNSDKCITPCITNKRAERVFRRSSNVSHKRFLEVSLNKMYTSTPVPVNVTSNISNQLSTPLIAMKISQLYNKSTILLNNTMHVTPERTLRESSIEKLERSASLRIKLARKACLNDLTKSSDEKVDIDQNSESSSKKINKSDDLGSNEHVHSEGKSNSGTDNSVETVIEKTITTQTSTFMLTSHNIDSIKTPIESKRSVIESLPNKSLKIRSFEKSSKHSSSKHSINKSVKSLFRTPVTLNISPISRNTSIIHGNISSKMTSSTDRVPKKCNSSIKRDENKAIISDGTPKVSR